MAKIAYRRIPVDRIEIFYREAGRANAPVLLLLHGFPTASHMFRALIPELADQFHVVAPDLPGFGQSEMPERTKFSYTFDNIARVVDRFTEVIGLGRFAIYVFDYGAPTGFRLAMWHPDRITAIISQNGNAYVEASATPGTRSAHTGRTRPKQTARPSAPSFRQRRRSGSTPTASLTHPRFLRTDIRSITSM